MVINGNGTNAFLDTEAKVKMLIKVAPGLGLEMPKCLIVSDIRGLLEETSLTLS